MNDDQLEARVRDDLRAAAAHPVPDRLAARIVDVPSSAPTAGRSRWWPGLLGGFAAAAAVVLLALVAVVALPQASPAATMTAPTATPSSPSAAPSSSLGALPGEAWTGLRWSAPAMTEPYESLSDVVAWDGAYVAVGQRQITTGSGGSQAMAWISRDWTTWTPTMADVPSTGDSSLGRLFVVSGRLVAIGWSGKDTCTGPTGEGATCRSAPVAVWTSVDGRTWTHEASPPELAGVSVTAVASNGRTIVLAGDTGWNKPVVWTSGDGVGWQSVALAPGDFRDAHFAGIAAVPIGFVLTGSRGGREPSGGVAGNGGGTAAAWYSADGVSWTAAQVAEAADPSGADSAIGRVFVGRDGLTAWGSGNSSAGWLSAAGTSWAPVPASAGVPIGAQASDGNRIVGAAYTNGGGESWWTSTDGRTWRLLAGVGDTAAAPAWSSTTGATADAEFLFPNGMGVIGQNGTERFPIWFAQAVTGTVPPAATPPASPSAVSVVPWIDATPTPVPSPTNAPVPPGTPACTASDLTARVGWQGATGSMAGGVTVTNTGSRTCALDGPPRKVVLRAGSNTVSHVTFSGQPFDVGSEPAIAPPVLLRPGDRASSFLVWSNECSAKPPTVTAVLVTLPDGSGSISATPDGPGIAGVPRCDVPDQASTLTAFAFVPVVDEAAPPDPQPAEVTIDAPASAAAGSTLDFRVTITNLGSAPVSLDPCPTYTENLIVDGRALKLPGYQQFLLNCAAIETTLGPGDTIVLEMQYAVPVSVPTGTVELFWGLDAGGPLDSSSGFARTPIAITGG